MSETEAKPAAAEPAVPLKPGVSARKILVQTLVTIAGVLGGVSLGAYFFRTEIRAFAVTWIAHTGYVGMFAGAFLSDSVMFPVPPQFYMLTAVAAGAPQIPSIAAVCLGSVAAANLVYPMSSRLAQIPFLRGRIEASRASIDPLFARYGYWAIAVGAVSPIPFSWLCYFAGMYRMPYRLYAIFVLFRIPRLLFFYALIRMGWGL